MAEVNFAETTDEFLKAAIEALRTPLPSVLVNRPSTNASKQAVLEMREQGDTLHFILEHEKNIQSDANAGFKKAVQAGASGSKDFHIGQAGQDKAFADQQQAEALAEVFRTVNAQFGLSPDGDIGILAKRISQTKPLADAALEEIKQLQNVSPIDDPIQWLLNGLQLPSKIQAYNAIATQINSDQDLINTNIGTAQRLAEQTAKGLPAITLAQAKAGADKAKAEADAIAAKANALHSMTQIDIGTRKLAAKMSIANATKDHTQLEIQTESLTLQAQIQNIKTAETHAQRLLAASQVMEKLAGTQAEKVLYNRIETMFGYEPGTLTKEGLARFRPEVRQSLEAAGLSGEYGGTILDAYETLKNARVGPNINPEVPRLLNYITEKGLAVQRSFQENMQYKQLPPEARRKEDLKKLTDLILADIAAAPKQSNIFSALTPASFLMADTQFAQSELGKAITPLADKDQEVPVQTIAETFLKHFDNNVTRAADALSTYYQRNLITRNDAIPYSALKIAPPIKYEIRVSTGMFSTLTADVTTLAGARNYLNILNLERIGKEKNKPIAERAQEEMFPSQFRR